ncbi:MAG: hypothetical protein B7Z37_29600 [Verrucomicrobia bacterium 12-59-8]|nr:MAG: hypothetical protein B7Z37_29600 [Verrucomicrobia bacterium 12-59-8]
MEKTMRCFLIALMMSLLVPVAEAGTTPDFTFTGFSSGSLAFDSDGNLFVASNEGTTVGKFAPGAATPSATLTGLNEPNALAFDSAGNLFVANQPSALAFDSAGNLYVANFPADTVSKFAPGATTPSVTLTGLNLPYRLAIDSSDNLYVANYGGTTVSKFAPGATTPSATLTGLNESPHALAVDSSGNLFVATPNNNTVSKFAPGATTPSATLTGLNGPFALAFDSTGNLFVANSLTDTVSKFAPGATTPSATLTGLNGPHALAVDSAGNLFVANVDGYDVSKFAPGATTPSATFTGLYWPDKLAFDSSGNLFVANRGNHTVSEFILTPLPVLFSVTPSVGSIVGGTSVSITGVNLAGATAVTIGGTPATLGTNTGTTLVLTTGAHAALDGASVLVTTSVGTNAANSLFKYAVPPTLTRSTANQFNDAPTLNIIGTGFDDTTPGNNTVDFYNGTNSAEGTVTAATSTTLTVTFTIPPTNLGALLATVSVSGISSGAAVQVATVAQNYTITTLTGLNAPNDLAFDSAGNLFVANFGANTVSKFAPGATTPSATLAGLNGPISLGFDSSGNLFVGNSDGTLSKVAPGATTPSATLPGSGSNDLAFDSADNLFVANSNYNSVIKFAPGATTPSAILTGGYFALGSPSSLACDSSGYLFVAIRGDNTVKTFAPGATTPFTTLTGLHWPGDLVFDSSGNLFVANFGAGTVSKFAPGATTPSATLTGLSWPTDLVFDSSGNLFVLNASGSTVSKFAPGATTPSAIFFTGTSGFFFGIGGLFGEALALAVDSSGNLFVTNAGNNTVSKIVSTTVMPEFTAWRLTHFGTNATAGNLADDASYVGDGLPNLLKYALGRSPLVATASSALSSIVNGSANSLLSDRLAIRFTLPNPAPADVTYTVQATDDLLNWTTVATKQGTGAWQWNTVAGGNTPHIVDPGTSPDTVEVGDVVPFSGNTRRMMRLQVTRP